MADGTHDVGVEILPEPNNVTLITPPNNTIIYNVNETYFEWNATNTYNSSTLIYRVYINNTLVHTTNDTNVTISGFAPIATYEWYVMAEYDNSTAFSETWYFSFTQDFYDDTGFYCQQNPNAEICQTVGGAGAGLAVFISYLGAPILNLMVAIMIAGMIYIIGMAIADKIGEK
jgi:hypothetical protein